MTVQLVQPSDGEKKNPGGGNTGEIQQDSKNVDTDEYSTIGDGVQEDNLVESALEDQRDGSGDKEMTADGHRIRKVTGKNGKTYTVDLDLEASARDNAEYFEKKKKEAAEKGQFAEVADIFSHVDDDYDVPSDEELRELAGFAEAFPDSAGLVADAYDLSTLSLKRFVARVVDDFDDSVITRSEAMGLVADAFLSDFASRFNCEFDPWNEFLLNEFGRAYRFVICQAVLVFRTKMKNKKVLNASQVRQLDQLPGWIVAKAIGHLFMLRRFSTGDEGLNYTGDRDELRVYVSSADHDAYGCWLDSRGVLNKKALLIQPGLNRAELQTIAEAVYDAAETVVPEANADLVPVANGVFDYRTKKLLDYAPEYYFTTKLATRLVDEAPELPVFDLPGGGTWDIESAIFEIAGGDAALAKCIWQVIGGVTRPNVRWNKLAMWHADNGNNGKGTLIELLRSLTGPDWYASVSLDAFNQRFGLSRLQGKYAVLVDENNVGAFHDNSAALKAAVTGDVLTIEEKHEPLRDIRFRGLMIQCVNDLPKIKDRSSSMYRRLYIVPFNTCFTGREIPEIKQKFIVDQATLEYVLYKVLVGMDDYYKLHECKAIKQALAQFRVENDVVEEFWYEIRDKIPYDAVPKDTLYLLYRLWYEKEYGKKTPMRKGTFGRQLNGIIDSDPDWASDVYRPNDSSYQYWDLVEAIDDTEYDSHVTRYDAAIDVIKIPKAFSFKSRQFRGVGRVEPRSTNNIDAVGAAVQPFWDEMRERFVWSALPYTFLCELYEKWCEKKNRKALDRATFKTGLELVAANDPLWKFPDNYKEGVDTAGNGSEPEMLIKLFELRNWENKDADPDSDLRWAPSFEQLGVVPGLERRTVEETAEIVELDQFKRSAYTPEFYKKLELGYKTPILVVGPDGKEYDSTETDIGMVKAFWRTIRNDFHWDMLPFEFLYDLYRKWQKLHDPGYGSHTIRVSYGQFVELLCSYVSDCESEWSNWYDVCASIDVAGKITTPHMAIKEYSLTQWQNFEYPFDDERRYIPKLIGPFAGIGGRLVVRDIQTQGASANNQQQPVTPPTAQEQVVDQDMSQTYPPHPDGGHYLPEGALPEQQ